MAKGDVQFRMGIKVKGLKELRAKLEPSRFDFVIFVTLGRVGAMMEEDSNGYPPQPQPANPKRRYRRTGRLGSSLTTEVVMNSEVYAVKLGSNVTYSPRVWAMPGDLPIGQAWMHKGVWTPLEESVRGNLDRYTTYIQEEIYGYLTE